MVPWNLFGKTTRLVRRPCKTLNLLTLCGFTFFKEEAHSVGLINFSRAYRSRSLAHGETVVAITFVGIDRNGMPFNLVLAGCQRFLRCDDQCLLVESPRIL